MIWLIHTIIHISPMGGKKGKSMHISPPPEFLESIEIGKRNLPILLITD
jgi:hypothetical protein